MEKNASSRTKYLVRAVKYFFYFCTLLALILAGLLATGLAKGGPSELFRDGWTSVGQIAVLFAFVAAIYPKMGFSHKELAVAEDDAALRKGIAEVMEMRGYRPEHDGDGRMTFRLRSRLNAVTRMLEDRITVTRTPDGIDLEGPTKDVLRVLSALQMRFRPEETE